MHQSVNSIPIAQHFHIVNAANNHVHSNTNFKSTSRSTDCDLQSVQQTKHTAGQQCLSSRLVACKQQHASATLLRLHPAVACVCNHVKNADPPSNYAADFIHLVWWCSLNGDSLATTHSCMHSQCAALDYQRPAYIQQNKIFRRAMITTLAGVPSACSSMVTGR